MLVIGSRGVVKKSITSESGIEKKLLASCTQAGTHISSPPCCLGSLASLAIMVYLLQVSNSSRYSGTPVKTSCGSPYFGQLAQFGGPKTRLNQTRTIVLVIEYDMSGMEHGESSNEGEGKLRARIEIES